MINHFTWRELLGSLLHYYRSIVDNLPALHPQHYEGDVQDLDLTFSLNEDCMGKLVTHELVPGGKAVPVTNVNKRVTFDT